MVNRGEFASHDEEFVRRLLDAGIEIENVYDIGASNGYWSARLKAVVPSARFDLFEPLASPQYAEMLAKVLQRHPDFLMHRVALGAENEELLLNIYDIHEGNSLIDSNWEGVKDKQPVTVRKLDEYAAEQHLPRPDIVKMDTQGFELNILRGGEKVCCSAKALMLETWLYRGYGKETPVLSEIIEWFDVRGFAMVGMGDAFASPDLRVQSIDTYFLRNDIASDLAKKGVELLTA